MVCQPVCSKCIHKCTNVYMWGMSGMYKGCNVSEMAAASAIMQELARHGELGIETLILSREYIKNRAACHSHI